MKQFFKIIGSARVLPRKRITAEDLDRRGHLEPGWTFRHTGVRDRYQAIDGEDGTSMAREAVLAALRSAQLKLADLELLVDASLSIQQPIPSNSSLAQEALGPEAFGCATMDIHASCMGFVVALQNVNGLFASGAYTKAVIVCAETPLRGVNWNEPESAHLMGDAAAAIALESCLPSENCAFRLRTYADGARLCRVEGGGHRLPPSAHTPENQASYQFQMDGKGIHRFASQHLPAMVKEAIECAGTPLAHLQVIPHQASGPAIELLSRRLGIRRDQLHSSIEEHGNLVAAGIPFVLHAVRSKLPAGTRMMLVGTAAGYSQAVAIFTL